MGRWLGCSDLITNDSLNVEQYHCCLGPQPCVLFAAILYALRFMHSVGESDLQSAKAKCLSANKTINYG